MAPVLADGRSSRQYRGVVDGLPDSAASIFERLRAEETAVPEVAPAPPPPKPEARPLPTLPAEEPQVPVPPDPPEPAVTAEARAPPPFAPPPPRLMAAAHQKGRVRKTTTAGTPGA